MASTGLRLIRDKGGSVLGNYFNFRSNSITWEISGTVFAVITWEISGTVFTFMTWEISGTVFTVTTLEISRKVIHCYNMGDIRDSIHCYNMGDIRDGIHCYCTTLETFLTIIYSTVLSIQKDTLLEEIHTGCR